jgi:putative FmdB family regulatory protein
MPNYQYQCAHCCHEFERQLKIEERNFPTYDSCPNCDLIGYINKKIGSPMMVRDTPRLDNGFREVLSKIHEKTPGSVLKDNIR